MADKKISELVELVTPSATDKLPIVDGSGTKYIEYQNLVPNQATDLSYTASPTNGTVVSSTGTDATIPLATNTDAGLLTPAEKTVISNTSGTNTGDETQSTIETKLGFASVTASTIAFFNATKNLISATGSNLGTFFQTFTAKSTPIDADTIIVNDSASSFEAKKTTLTQFKAFLKTYFDTIYGGTSGLTNNFLPKFNGTSFINSKLNELASTLSFSSSDAGTILKSESTFAGADSRIQSVKASTIAQLIAFDTEAELYLAKGDATSKTTRIWTPQFKLECNATSITNTITGTIQHSLICAGHSGDLGNAHIMSSAFGQEFRSAKKFVFANDRFSSNYKEVFRIDIENHRVILYDNTNTNPVEKIRFDANSQNNIQLTTGAKVGNNTDTSIVAGAGSIKYNAGKLSFSNGTNWGDIENDRNIVSPIATYTILSTDHILLNNQSSTWTLPSNTSLIGKKYLIYLNNNTLTLNSDGVDLLNGAFFISFGASYKAIEVRCLASGVWLTNMV